MANTGKTIATLFIGATVGAAVGYILASDKDSRKEDLEKIKDSIAGLKDKFSKKSEDIEEEIFHS